MGTPADLVLRTSTDTLRFAADSGALISLRPLAAPGQELISCPPDAPTFILQYLDAERHFQQLSSQDAAKVSLRCEADATTEGVTVLSAEYRQLGGRDVNVSIQVWASRAERFSRWSLRLYNGAGLQIVGVQFPFIVLPYGLGSAAQEDALVWPLGPGSLLRHPQPEDLAPDCPFTWQMRPENSDSLHYPGYTVAQFLAYYNERAGLYLACEDAAGFIKQFKPVHHPNGLRLGVQHVGDWPRAGERQLSYQVVLGSFSGDWYAAADLYRTWSLQQPWARQPLHRRENVPAWLLDSPPHIVVRIQGILDAGPTDPNPEFQPYRRCLPLLDALAQRIDAPLVPVIMSWERPGPWIYPDCFPVAGGNEPLREFCALARERGWHIGTFCNGTRWVTGHFWSGYDGEAYFQERGGAASVCRTHAGELWQEDWDRTWRPSYACCVGSAMTRQIAEAFVQTILDLGLDWIQFFDQNIGCSSFPCFAQDHGHAPEPGRWMTVAMQQLVDGFHALAAAPERCAEQQRSVAFSVEGPVNEFYLPSFAVCDVRVLPPGHSIGGGWFNRGFIPLYHYLYHEFVVIQGGFGYGPEPYHMPIRNAYNLVVGEIPGAVLKGDGELLNRDTGNWAPWYPQVGSNDDAVEMLRVTTALRRGPGKDFLVYGRMQPPCRLGAVPIVNWQEGGHDHNIPAVFDAAWQAPDGSFALVLANWTNEAQVVDVREARLQGRLTLHLSARDLSSTPLQADGAFTVRLPALSCALVEARSG